MIRPGRTRLALLATAATLVAGSTAASAQAADPPAFAAATGVSIDVKTKGKVALLKKVVAEGALANALPNDNVMVTVKASGRELFTKKLTPKPDGTFEVPITVDACCNYEVIAENAGKTDKATFRVDIPKKLGKGPVTRLFNRSLQAQGFHTGNNGSRVNIGTRLAIKAFRKTNNMARSFAYSPAIFEKLLQDKGGFVAAHPDAGRHVEVDISKQVMSLMVGDTPVHTFHVSTGAPATPTIRGKFNFYMRQAGYNAKRMYYSVYFRGGYATHGYSEVPNYNASHGCVRNPIPFSRFIYNWVEIGMPIYVYL